MSHTLNASTPITTHRSGMEMQSLTADPTSYPIGEIEVHAGERSHMSLGSFTKAQVPKGFSIRIIPDSSEGNVDAHITRSESANDYCELVLHIVNNGDNTATAEVWQLL
ncbi:MAG TPA: hypothetical protein VFT59_02100 [Candidatus Saccharimonadales bacterium]|nr:hypothetical protein [Candidatus Saccharimonadales bacterium]